MQRVAPERAGGMAAGRSGASSLDELPGQVCMVASDATMRFEADLRWEIALVEQGLEGDDGCRIGGQVALNTELAGVPANQAHRLGHADRVGEQREPQEEGVILRNPL